MRLRLIKLKDVMDTTGLARSTIYKYIKNGTFPKPVKLGERNVAWEENEIQDWIMEKLEHREEE